MNTQQILPLMEDAVDVANKNSAAHFIYQLIQFGIIKKAKLRMTMMAGETWRRVVKNVMTRQKL